MPEVNHIKQEIEDTAENRFRTPAVMRAAMLALSHLVPPLAVKLATYLFCRPKRGLIKPDEEGMMAAAESFDLDINGQRLAAWSWGNGPTVLLQHGWSSRGSRLAGFVAPLTAAGFRVVSYDAPAHGESEGRITTGPDISRTLREIASRLGGLHSIIAHSMGCWVAALAMKEGLLVERLVFISPPSDLSLFSDLFARQMGFTPKIQKRVEEILAKRTGVPWSEMKAEGLSVGQDTPLLIIHDRGDLVVLLHHAEALHNAWEGSRLLITSGLGHRLTVKDSEVVTSTVEFIAERPAAGRIRT